MQFFCFDYVEVNVMFEFVSISEWNRMIIIFKAFNYFLAFKNDDWKQNSECQQNNNLHKRQW